MKIRHSATEYLTVFSIGGVLYSFLEILARGYTHWSMTLTGGWCFLSVYLIHVRLRRRLHLVYRCLLGGLVITGSELAVGCLVNRTLGWDVWNYSRMPANVLGQICLPFTLLWCALCLVAAPICFVLRRVLRRKRKSPRRLLTE